MLLLAISGLVWHIFAITAMILMAPYGKKWEGFYISLLGGPIGFLAVLVMLSNLRDEERRNAPEIPALN